MIYSEQSTGSCDAKLKIVFLGDMGVGKTSIIDRFVRDDFIEQNQPTVGIDFLSRNMTYGGDTYRLQLWDTAGQQKYRSLVPAYLRDVNCAVFVFDITNSTSLDSLKAWIQLFRDYQPQHATAILVGNKSDQNQTRQILQQQGRKLAKNQNMQYFEVSAKTGSNVFKIFQHLVKEISDKSVRSKKKIELSETDSKDVSDRFFKKYQKIKLQHDTLKQAPCCYI